METYDLVLLLVGIVLLGVSILPRFLDQKPISLPIFFVGFGMLVFSLPLGLPTISPVDQSILTERLAELGVIIALMGVGLKIERPPGLKAWRPAWRLLGITMPLTIACTALIGWWLGLLVPAALLLGACIAPTDPVLASEVQVEEPRILAEDEEGEGTDEGAEEDRIAQEDEVRFALTSEAGLNDGLAFPFTNAAILMALAGVAPGGWFAEWLVVDVGYKILMGVLLGVGLGWSLGFVIFHTAAREELARALAGLEAVAGVFVVYGVTEFVGGYGFIAVFLAAVTIRQLERGHAYHRELHETVEIGEHVVMAVIMFFFGGAIAGGLLASLSLRAWLAAGVVVVLVRPVTGALGLVGWQGTPMGWARRGTIAFFGVRGIATFYYLAHGINAASFGDVDLLWGLAGVIVLTSVVVHGILATPVMERVEEMGSLDARSQIDGVG